MMDLTRILDDCLLRLASGQGRTEVLALYPEQAHRLAPMLDAAVRLSALSGKHLSDPQKLRAKVALRYAMAERAQPRPRLVWPRLRALPVALILAAVLVTALSVSVVASSKPGDMAYPLRIAVEQVPSLVQFTAAGRASAELDIADRRMADLGGYLSSTGQAYPLALAAMLEGDEAAAGRAARLSDAQRAGVAARIMGHADALETLAGTAPGPADAQRLRTAAERSRWIANGLKQNQPAPVDIPTTPSDLTGTPTLTPTVVSATGRPTDAPAVAPTSTPLPTDTIVPTRTPRPRLPVPSATVTRQPGQGPLATRVRPASIVTGQPTPLVPRPIHTLLPTRTPPRSAETPRPTRPPQPEGTATRVGPSPPRGTPIPTDAPTSIPKETPVIAPADTAVPPPVDTPTREAPGPTGAQTPLPGPGATPGNGQHTPGPRSTPGGRP